MAGAGSAAGIYQLPAEGHRSGVIDLIRVCCGGVEVQLFVILLVLHIHGI